MREINFYRRNSRLGKVTYNNHSNNAIIPDVLLGPILTTAAMEDFDSDKSALFVLVRNAIVSQEASPLHEKIVDFLREA